MNRRSFIMGSAAVATAGFSDFSLPGQYVGGPPWLTSRFPGYCLQAEEGGDVLTVEWLKFTVPLAIDRSDPGEQFDFKVAFPPQPFLEMRCKVNNGEWREVTLRPFDGNKFDLDPLIPGCVLELPLIDV